MIQIGMLSVVGYIAISILVMFFYHGGDMFDLNRSTYNFFGSFLSDLGRLHGFSGVTSYTTGIIYGIGLGFMGIGTILFFWAHQYLVPKTIAIVKHGATIVGIITGIGYIGIACTPWDIVPKTHLFFVFTGFISFSICCLLMFIIVIKDSSYPTIFGYIYLFLCLWNLTYVLFMIYGPDSREPVGRIVQATAQKIVIYTQSALTIYCAYGAVLVSKKRKEKLNGQTSKS